MLNFNCMCIYNRFDYVDKINTHTHTHRKVDNTPKKCNF